MPWSAADSQELQRQADLALSHVKRSGRARFALFDEALHKGMQRDSMMEFQLRHALEAGEFFLEYLPFVWLEEKGKEDGVITLESGLQYKVLKSGKPYAKSPFPSTSCLCKYKWAVPCRSEEL